MNGKELFCKKIEYIIQQKGSLEFRILSEHEEFLIKADPISISLAYGSPFVDESVESTGSGYRVDGARVTPSVSRVVGMCNTTHPIVHIRGTYEIAPNLPEFVEVHRCQNKEGGFNYERTPSTLQQLKEPQEQNKDPFMAFCDALDKSIEKQESKGENK